ncbi:DUF6461 domain-containing protein [Streptomyces rochei]|uniref:DUF6461 domain-containing protein n=1 Tax=Streptomyces rochei TaxID=1928 RepID=UPI0037895E82
MSNGIQWLRHSFEEGFCVAFCEEITPEDFIRRIGGDPSKSLELTREQAEVIDLASRYPEEEDLESHDLDADELREIGFLRPDIEVLRVGSANGWAFSLQSFGSFMSDSGIARKASRGSRYISFTQTVNMASWVQYAVDGILINSFDPIHPVAGPAKGLQIDALGENPSAAMLAQLEERFRLEVPKDTDHQPLKTVALSR